MLYIVLTSKHKNLWPWIAKSGFWVDDRGTEVLFPTDPRESLFQKRPDFFWSPYCLVCVEYLGIFSGSNEADRAADHPPHSSAMVKNLWSCTSTLLLFDGHRKKSTSHHFTHSKWLCESFVFL